MTCGAPTFKSEFKLGAGMASRSVAMPVLAPSLRYAGVFILAAPDAAAVLRDR